MFRFNILQKTIDSLNKELIYEKCKNGNGSDNKDLNYEKYEKTNILDKYPINIYKNNDKKRTNKIAYEYDYFVECKRKIMEINLLTSMFFCSII